jgi:hypothetical protein
LSNSTVTIGSISLQDFEIPTSIQFGGRQRLVVHRVSDGTRTVEPLGPDDSQIRFQGIFSGPDAESRVRALDNLRLSGAIVWLTWQSFRYKVIIDTLLVSYHSRWWISYRISCVVVHQSGVLASDLITTQTVVAGALLVALGALAGTQIDLGPLSTAVGISGALIAGTTANTQASALAAASLSAVQSEVDQQSTVLVSANQNSSSPAAAAASFALQLGCTASLANAVSARSRVERICISLNSPGDRF